MRREERIQEDTPAPVGLLLGHALIERTALAIEAEVRRHVVVADLYMSMVREVFAVTGLPSPNLSFLEGSSVSANAGRAEHPSWEAGDARTPATFALSALSSSSGSRPQLSVLLAEPTVSTDPVVRASDPSDDASAVSASAPGDAGRPAGGLP